MGVKAEAEVIYSPFQWYVFSLLCHSFISQIFACYQWFMVQRVHLSVRVGIYT